MLLGQLVVARQQPWSATQKTSHKLVQPGQLKLSRCPITRAAVGLRLQQLKLSAPRVDILEQPVCALPPVQIQIFPLTLLVAVVGCEAHKSMNRSRRMR